MRHLAVILSWFLPMPLLAGPVSLSFEYFNWIIDINHADNQYINLSQVEAGMQNCSNSLAASYGDSCFYFSRQGERAAISEPPGYWGGFAGTAIGGFNYESSVYSDDSIFVLSSTARVYTEATYPVDFPEVINGGSFTSPTVSVKQRTYWVEFVVAEQVLYSGTHSLTTGGYTQFGSPDAFFESGSILEPGTYQFFLGCIDCPTGISGEDIPYSYSTAERGESVYNENSREFEFEFTVVPIPAAAWLFGSALIGLGFVRRKRG